MISVNDVLDMIAALCRLPEGRSVLPAWWTSIATRALDAANRDVQGILAARGLTPTQLGTWTGFDSAVIQQATYWAWVEGGPLQNNVPQESAEPVDLREWLWKVTLVDAAGAYIVPDPGTRAVGHGAVAGGWNEVKAKSPNKRLGFVDSSGRFMDW